ncbi:hypothetical protein DYQ91_14730 [Xanthomonas sp. LMG 8989]|nr:hypothetical protein [Xanthomonas sp. LMG 8989]
MAEAASRTLKPLSLRERGWGEGTARSARPPACLTRSALRAARSAPRLMSYPAPWGCCGLVRRIGA